MCEMFSVYEETPVAGEPGRPSAPLSFLLHSCVLKLNKSKSGPGNTSAGDTKSPDPPSWVVYETGECSSSTPGKEGLQPSRQGSEGQ